MARKNYRSYPAKLRKKAIKMIIEEGKTTYKTSQELSLPKSTLESWIKAYKSKSSKNTADHKPSYADLEQELDRVNQEIDRVKTERDIFKKVTAHFAQETL